MSDQPARGWRVTIGEVPAQTVLAMPDHLRKATANYLRALAIEAGGAIDLDRRPPGVPMDDAGLRYALQIEREPILLEYLALPEARMIRIAVIVWYEQ
ncbi:hypothetical protein [Streptomyces lushanensis]|uniref:hypothetical protein n=1 Tax=Streptomyces lushanensis TaxID=1434255 RepID=UPI00083457E9|nr:hypothetical protein [Streptomyces lushanensis]